MLRLCGAKLNAWRPNGINQEIRSCSKTLPELRNSWNVLWGRRKRPSKRRMRSCATSWHSRRRERTLGRGRMIPREVCLAVGKDCFKCGTRGLFGRVCKKAPKQQSQPRYVQKMVRVAETHGGGAVPTPILNIKEEQRRLKPWSPSIEGEVLLSWQVLQKLGVINSYFPNIEIRAAVASTTLHPKDTCYEQDEQSKLTNMIREFDWVFNEDSLLRTMKGDPMRIHIKHPADCLQTKEDTHCLLGSGKSQNCLWPQTGHHRKCRQGITMVFTYVIRSQNEWQGLLGCRPSPVK